MVDDIGSRIYELRRAKRLSQEELANQIGVSPKAISKWENGDAFPTLDNTVKLADIFGVSTDYLLGRDEDAKDDRKPEASKKMDNPAKTRRTEKEDSPVSFFNLLYLIYPIAMLILYAFPLANIGGSIYYVTQNGFQARISSGFGIFCLIRIALFFVSMVVFVPLSIALPQRKSKNRDKRILFIRTFGFSLFHYIFFIMIGTNINPGILVFGNIIPAFGDAFALLVRIFSRKDERRQKAKAHFSHHRSFWTLFLFLRSLLLPLAFYSCATRQTQDGWLTVWAFLSSGDSLVATRGWLLCLFPFAVAIYAAVVFFLCDRKHERIYFWVSLGSYRLQFVFRLIAYFALRATGIEAVFVLISPLLARLIPSLAFLIEKLLREKHLSERESD